MNKSVAIFRKIFLTKLEQQKCYPNARETARHQLADDRNQKQSEIKMNKPKTLLMVLAASMLLTNSLLAQNTEINDIALYLHDGVEVLDFTGPLEVFTQAGFNVYTVGMTTEPIVSQRVLKVLPEYSIENCPQPDVIAFFGGGSARTQARNVRLQAWIKKVIQRTKINFSVCSGAFFLGEAGLLDGMKVTTFHTLLDVLQKDFPKTEVLKDVRFVDNGEVITTAGISAGIDGAIHLVEKIKGIQVAQRVVKNMEYDKWVRDEGLILESNLMKVARRQGFATAAKLKQSSELNGSFYKGELSQFGNEMLTRGEQREALEIFEYLAQNFQRSFYDFEDLRKAYRANDKKIPPTEDEFITLARAGEVDKVRELYQKAYRAFPDWTLFRDWRMNQTGYEFMSRGEFASALAIFKFNAEVYPSGWNMHDSLAEAYMELGQDREAIANYRKSLELNPNNQNGRRMLEKLTGTN